MLLNLHEHGHLGVTFNEVQGLLVSYAENSFIQISLFPFASLSPTPTVQPLPIPVRLTSVYNLSCSSMCHTINVITTLCSLQPSLASDHRKRPPRGEKMDFQRLEWPLNRYTGAKIHRREEIKQNTDLWCLPLSSLTKRVILHLWHSYWAVILFIERVFKVFLL